MANHDNYVIQGNTLDAIAAEVKTLSDTSDMMTVSQITSNIAQANADVEAQVSLIRQIKTALDGKASGGGGTEEIENLIDQSGVLENTEGTVEDKVEQLIDYAYAHKVVNMGFAKNSSLACNIFRNTDVEDVSMFDFSPVKYFVDMFFACAKIKNIEINTDNGTNFQRMCTNCYALENISLSSTKNGTNFNGTLSGCRVLKNAGAWDLSNATNVTNFYNASALEEIRIVEQTLKLSFAISSPVLSDESIQSIIDGLATVTTAQTLTLHADVKAKLTQDQLATITSKNWNLA